MSGPPRQCAYPEIKLRAERRAGELLQEMGKREERHSGRNLGLQDETPRPTLADLGIDKVQSHRYQTIARLPEEEFEAHLAETKAEGPVAPAREAFGLCFIVDEKPDPRQRRCPQASRCGSRAAARARKTG